MFNIENPPVNQEGSGVTTLSGWVYSTTGNPVTVKAIVDGGAIELSPLCCGPRPDVQAGNPGAPLNTSFSLLVNYNELTPGDHTIVFEFSADGEMNEQTSARTITVVKPGARSGAAASSFRFLSDLETTNANTAVDPDTGELIIAPVRAVNSEGGAERDATVRLGWKQNLQSFVTTSAASGTEFAAVQQIFNNSCAAVAGCHLGPEPFTGLNLSAGNAFRNLVPIKSSEDDGRFRINPGDPDASYLYRKIIGAPGIVGGRMPLGCSGATCLSDTETQTILDWISNGAPPPQP
jgi:hypothetical protein